MPGGTGANSSPADTGAVSTPAAARTQQHLRGPRHLVSRFVTVAVVDGLETVEVEGASANLTPTPARKHLRLVQPVEEENIRLGDR
jgi:hypothetical protein